MPTRNWRGINIPDPDEPLIDALQVLGASLQVAIPVASVAAASLLLTQAETLGAGVSTASPALFLVGAGPRKVAYTADGSKTNGKWNLAPLNETEVADDTYETAWSGYKNFSVAGQAQSQMMKTSLPVAPYDRRVIADAVAYGQRVAGAPMLRLVMHNGRVSYGRFDVDPGTVACPPLSCIVPAGATPNISVQLHGGNSSGGTNTASLAGTESMSALQVTAFPVLMGA